MFIFEESHEMIITWCFVLQFTPKGERVGDFVNRIYFIEHIVYLLT